MATTLYRPVGAGELAKIIAAGGRAFPPRFTWQPIFYPVLDETYAIEIARDWNTTDEASGFAGFVTAFDVPDAAIAGYPVQTVGARRHQELWVPADDLPAFNAALIAPIRVLHAFFGERFAGDCAMADVLRRSA